MKEILQNNNALENKPLTDQLQKDNQNQDRFKRRALQREGMSQESARSMYSLMLRQAKLHSSMEEYKPRI